MNERNSLGFEAWLADRPIRYLIGSLALAILFSYRRLRTRLFG
jgi:hypothetical protein